MWGKAKDELLDVTKILAGSRFGGFEVRCSSRPSWAIGPRRMAMKSLEFDGKGKATVLSSFTNPEDSGNSVVRGA